MKKLILSLIMCIIGSLIVNSQNKDFLLYFPYIKYDTVINTMLEQNTYYERTAKDNLPDLVALKYIFSNNPNNMYGEEEGYNVDDHSYFTTSFTKKVVPLFIKKKGDDYLIGYGIKSVLYVGIYDACADTINKTLIVADFYDDMGNIVTHSIIFPTNYIVSVNIGDKTKYELMKIDYKLGAFEVLKSITVDRDIINPKSFFNDAFKVLGISEDGILIE